MKEDDFGFSGCCGCLGILGFIVFIIGAASESIPLVLVGLAVLFLFGIIFNIIENFLSGFCVIPKLVSSVPPIVIEIISLSGVNIGISSVSEKSFWKLYSVNEDREALFSMLWKVFESDA